MNEKTMDKPKKQKVELHPRNKHHGRYDLKLLAKASPDLSAFVITNDYGDETIDFFNHEAVKSLNKALLLHYYGVKSWNIPEGYLCPPIPGRADYVHHIADLMAESNAGNIPTGVKIKCLDIGVGANCVYPIIGRKEYDWSFIGSETDEKAIKCASAIIKANTKLKGKIELRLQPNVKNTLIGVLAKDERVDITICNPPFHATMADAAKSTLRKLENLTETKVEKVELNFGGQASELTCEGGEARFVRDMVRESRLYAPNCFWFSTLISKHEHVELAYKAIRAAKASDVRTIKMGQGSKLSRVVAWSFLTASQRAKWVEERWQ
jgi:23S rRNA (adenine1618-N6)-methyltransferase